MDEKLELFFSKQLWEDTVQKCVNKRINRELLAKYCETENRIMLAEVIANKKYNIAPPSIGKVPKPDGGVRKVYINTELDRLVLSLINDVYQILYKNKISKYCVSYQKGIGVSSIIKRITSEITQTECESDVLGYKVDISKYFDSVNKETLFKALDELNTDSAIDYIVRQYYTEDLIIDEDGNLVEKYKSLAQGCAVSSFLANYILKDIDDTLSKLDIIYYRYSDDILMVGKDSKKALQLLEGMLKEKGLLLNPKKVEELKKGEWFTFLGFKINGDKVTFSESSMERFKDEVRQRCKVTKDVKLKSRMTLRQTISKLNKYMYTAYLKKNSNFGWAEYMFSTINQIEDIEYLDKFVKDHIRHMYTGKWNSYSNYNKVSNDFLQELGYVSMVHLFKLFNIKKNLYRAEIRRIMM